MEFPPTLHNFRARIKDLHKPSFLRIYPEPFLPFKLGIIPGDSSGFGVDTKTFASQKTTDADPEGVKRSPDIFVARVEKSGRNNHDGGITLGRGLDNDIVIPHPSVSKFHASFEWEAEEEAWRLWDRGASYGTTIQGIDVVRGSFRTIRSGDVILFAGSVQATFLSAADFYEYIHLA
jgi:hypothetical protein